MVLLNLAGTIPVKYKEETYNIPGTKAFLYMIKTCLNQVISLTKKNVEISVKPKKTVCAHKRAHNSEWGSKLKLKLHISTIDVYSHISKLKHLVNYLPVSSGLDAEGVSRPTPALLRRPHQEHGDQCLAFCGSLRLDRGTYIEWLLRTHCARVQGNRHTKIQLCDCCRSNQKP